MSKRLITDHDVLTGSCGARIVLDGETLITPSARDRALRLGIAVVEAGDVSGGNAGQSGSGACSQCGSAAHAGDSRCIHAAPHGFSAAVAAGLPDGLYLVRIDGGRIVSTLPAAGAGLMPRAHSSRTSRS